MKDIKNEVFIDLDKTEEIELPKLTSFQGLVTIKKNGRIIVRNSILEDIDTFSDKDIEYILTHFKQYISPILTSSYIPTSSMMEIVKRTAPEFKVRFKTEKPGGNKIVAISPEEYFSGEKYLRDILDGLDSSWNEEQKYRYLYLKTGEMLSYDLNVLSYQKNASTHEQYSRNIFTSISNNWGICASFASIYDYLCYRSGLESMVLSEDDHDYVLITDSQGRDYLTDPTFDSAKVKFGLRTTNYATSKEEFESNSHNLKESEVSEYEFSSMDSKQIEDLDRSIGYLDNFDGEYIDDKLSRLANNLKGETNAEKLKDFLERIKGVKTIGRVTDSDYIEIINWILSKSSDREFADGVDISSFVYEDTKELPRRILFKVQDNGEDTKTYIELDYKSKAYKEVDESDILKIQDRGIEL